MRVYVLVVYGDRGEVLDVMASQVKPTEPIPANMSLHETELTWGAVLR
jgi:hypothetical protein